MAAADCVVGAVSMPLSITLDVLLLRKDLSHTICEIAFANQLVLYATACSSLYHLTVIAWERYVAVTKWMQYNVIIQRRRTRRLARNTWLLAVSTTSPVRILKAAGVPFKYLEVLDSILSLPAVVCIALIAYFYARVYLGMRKQTLDEMRCTERIRARREKSVALKTLLLTAVLLVCYIPSIIVLLCGNAVSFLRTSSFFRWSELLIQLNSLVNPLIYCFAMNSRFRVGILQMLNIRKSETQTTPGLERRRAWQIEAEERLEDAQECQEEQQSDCARLGACSDVFLRPYHQRRMGDPMPSSSPEVSRRVTFVDVHQPN